MPKRRPARLSLPLSLALAATAGGQILAPDGNSRTIEPWAAKGLMQSPVSICLDPWGNIYVAQTERAGNAVQDTRNIGHLHAVEDDLKFKSVADRRAQIRRWLSEGAFEPDYFTRTADSVRVVSDTDGDGEADTSADFAGPFNDELDGIGSGVLWLDGTLYYTCIPHLWALPDKDHNLIADSRKSLAEGFGVRWCFYGHDLHGLVPGPDGRIYFSVGDRGYNITTPEGSHLFGPDRGGVFRCWPDGSGLELFYDGLRNPQELAFTELGDLFTGDNNSDSGDRARVVHIIEGGDSGWRQDVQSLEGTDWGETSDIHAYDSRGPWNREFMWHTLADSAGPARPAWSLPPIAYMGAGPSGLALYPGTGESDAFNGCLFLVDFRGGDSSINAFRPVPLGASFEVADRVEFYKGPATITDIAWGYDGRLYLSDWGGGWSPNPNGTILTITNTTVHDDPAQADAIAEVGALFKQGFSDRPANDLLSLLGHRDQRVRLNAQYSLAGRGLAVGELSSLAGDEHAAPIARIHAIWTLGQMARQRPEITTRLLPLLADPDPEIRTQALRTLGDQSGQQGPEYFRPYIALLADPQPRVRLAAAYAVAHHCGSEAVEPLLALLTDTFNTDMALRHAASFALSRVADADDLADCAQGQSLSAAARLGIVLALRRAGSARAADFLNDEDLGVALESARAIYDLRLPSGLPLLAAALDAPIPEDRAIEPLLRRAIEAAVLLGGQENASRLAAFALRPGPAMKWRRLALERLLAWDAPLDREGVWGNWVGLPGRDRADVASAISPRIDQMIIAASGEDEILPFVFRLQARYTLNLSAEGLAARAADDSLSDTERLAVLDQLVAQDPGGLPLRSLSADLLAGDSGPLRWRAMQLAASTDPAGAVTPLAAAAVSGPVRDRQHAIAALSTIDSDEARAVLAGLATSLEFDSGNRDTALDIYLASRSLPGDSPARATADRAAKQGDRPEGFATRFLTDGGDPTEGRRIFFTKASSECIRCHTTEGPPTETAPSLLGVGARLSPDLLVQSIVEPQAVIAAGFTRPSAMPEMTRLLQPREVRDIVAYLKTLDGSVASIRRSPTTPARAAPAPTRSHAAAGSTAYTLGLIVAGALAVIVWRGMARRA